MFWLVGMCLLSCMNLNRNCFCSKEFALQESQETKRLESSPSIFPLCPRVLKRREEKDINTFLFRLSITSVAQRNTVIIFASIPDLVVGRLAFSFPLLNYKKRMFQNYFSFQTGKIKEEKKDNTRMHNAGHLWTTFKEILGTNRYGEKKLIINDTVQLLSKNPEVCKRKGYPKV